MRAAAIRRIAFPTPEDAPFLLLASASAVIHVGANVVLIPAFGIFGAAVASILGYGTGALILLAVPGTRAFITPLFRASAVPVLASLMFLVVARVVGLYLLLGALVCGAVSTANTSPPGSAQGGCDDLPHPPQQQGARRSR